MDMSMKCIKKYMYFKVVSCYLFCSVDLMAQNDNYLLDDSVIHVDTNK
jgi:hypothetical protein